MQPLSPNQTSEKSKKERGETEAAASAPVERTVRADTPIFDIS